MSAPALLDPAGFDTWRNDRRSGAAALTRAAGELLLAGVERSEPRRAAALLPATLRELGRAHPAFGSLWRLLDRAFRVAEKARQEKTSEADLAARVAAAVRAFLDDLVAAETELARAGAELVPEGALVATYSRSHAVERSLLEARTRGRRLRVLLAESRPGLEGTAMAEALSRQGIACVLTADAMLPMLASRARLLLLGADAVTPRGFVHKAGTYPLLLAAREHNVPAYVLAVRAKFLDPREGTLALPLHPPEWLWANAPPGVEVTNVPFEECPFNLIQGVVTETSLLGSTEAAQAARSAPLHASLAAAGSS